MGGGINIFGLVIGLAILVAIILGAYALLAPRRR